MKEALWYSDYEICKSYDNAANKPEQIHILAQLNDCAEKVILQILADNGRKVEKRPMSKITGRTEWTPEMDNIMLQMTEFDVPALDIAEKLGVNVSSIYSRRKYLRNKGVKVPIVPTSRKKEPVKIAEPVIESVSPVVENAEPVVENAEPVIKTESPVMHSPIAQNPTPPAPSALEFDFISGIASFIELANFLSIVIKGVAASEEQLILTGDFNGHLYEIHMKKRGNK